MNINDLSFYNGKRVFLTGHTGFKGTWLSKLLLIAGAELTGYSLNPPTTPSLFALAGLKSEMHSITGDIRDFETLNKALKSANPNIVIHLAAQPIVLESYKDPLTTYGTNIMGTVNLLECIRLLTEKHDQSCSVLNVTTDKVYLNNEWPWGYRENEPLDGFDPYSNSKSCSELVTHAYTNSFFSNSKVTVSTARAGNVIGGGDFAENRIIPDCVRSAKRRDIINIRNPYSTRPYQHVLEPLSAYLTIIKGQSYDNRLAGCYNVGPDDRDCVTNEILVNLFCKFWKDDISWTSQSDINPPHEANFLKLDSSKIKSTFGWYPKWHIAKAMEITVQFYKSWLAGTSVASEMENEIMNYLEYQYETLE